MAAFEAASSTAFVLARLTQRKVFDVAVTNETGQLFLISGARDGRFSSAQPQLLSTGVLALLGAGDLDGDGLDELVVQTSAQSVAVLSRAQEFMPISIQLVNDRNYGRAALADTDGDGASELLLSDAELHTDVYKQVRGTWTSNIQLPGQLLIATDLNQDGRADLLLNRASTLAVQLARSDGTFANGQEFSGKGAVATDLDGDGALDVELIRDAGLVRLQGHADGSFEEGARLDISTWGKELSAVVSLAGTELLLGSSASSSRLSHACLAR